MNLIFRRKIILFSINILRKIVEVQMIAYEVNCALLIRKFKRLKTWLKIKNTALLRVNFNLR